MGYEDSVYLAKLAEQAERYEGISPRPLQPLQPPLTPCAFRNGRKHESRRLSRPRTLRRRT